MRKRTVALLSGGISSEREVSLKSGDQVCEALDKEKYDVRRYDPECDLKRLVDEAARIDVALIILHGEFGEDGRIQGLLDLLNIPYQGSGVLGSATAMNKLVSKQLYEKAGLPVPSFIAFNRGDRVEPEAVIKQLGLPVVVKPASNGSSIGMSIARAVDDIVQAVEKAFEYDELILLESFIEGIELTCGVIGNDAVEALPVIEIVPKQGHDFFDYHAKYTAGETSEICPARIDDAVAEKTKQYAVAAHQALFCSGYSRTDMILKGEDVYVLETNTIPGMTKTSLFPLAAQAGGISFADLLDKLIELGIQRHESIRQLKR
ncbi:MAG: D-alanine--D-alanine ligase [Desulfobacterales bacterium]|nr:D-alanine--D-alanine ligase [Desulfobacterales bacterium]MDD4071990.1 D-alanine--D-alanine ligase [Desulfobacterales bacterium]MDD4392258.1 D-alanine--D-alanine ligase [Desulfobacterales bacterium]